MKKSQNLREVLFFINGPEIDYSQIQGDAPTLNEYIRAGNSTLLISQKENNENSAFKTFIGFPIEMENFDIKTQEYAVDKLILAAPKQNLKSDKNDEEETFEIKYPSNPTKFCELASFDMTVITNSQDTAKICQYTDINYFYTTKGYDNTLVSNLIEAKPVDLLFIDFTHDEKDSVKIVEKIEYLISEFKDLTPYVRIILPLQSKYHHNAKSRHIESNKTYFEILTEIIPKQTWQFSQGDVKFDSSIETSVSIMINFKQNRNRKDKIETIKQYADPINFANFGGATVFSSSIIREISFELEKLPKFGA